MEAIIKGRKYRVEVSEPASENLRADMVARGWDGKHYAFFGVRGAVFCGFRSAKTGEYELGVRL